MGRIYTSVTKNKGTHQIHQYIIQFLLLRSSMIEFRKPIAEQLQLI
jgi:hypothetical protein